MRINAERVRKLFEYCLLSQEEERLNTLADPVKVEGIQLNVSLHPDRLNESKAEITEIVKQLHPTFKQGWSFMNLCTDHEGTQWTGFHKTCEELMMLALGIGVMDYCAPRDMWSSLPGGLPYLVVNIPEEADASLPSATDMIETIMEASRLSETVDAFDKMSAPSVAKLRDDFHSYMVQLSNATYNISQNPDVKHLHILLDSLFMMLREYEKTTGRKLNIQDFREGK